MASSEDVIKEFMRFKVKMEGSVNGHEFEIEGEGEGRPYEGTQTAKLKVTKGGPLPFSWDILSPQFQYGSKAYVKHPADIPDYLKLSFPEGFKWERFMNFEDGGVVTVTQDSTLQDGEFIYKVKLRGTNFPSDGPVMQKKTMGWEASTERMYPEDGALKGEIKMRLKLKDGGHYDAEVKTTYKAKKQVQLPGAYMTDIKLDIISHNGDYTIVEQYERAEGRHSTGAGGSGATNFSLLKQAGDVEENPGPMTEYKPTVRLATRDDVPRAVRTLAAAFADYPATRHTVDPDRHIERVTELQELFLTRVGLDIGKVWVADDGAAVAVWTTPESVEAGAVFAEIGPRMAELSGSRLAAQQQMEGLLAPHRPKEPAWFLATVGVSPDHQGKGLGSAVVLPGVEAAERAGVPAFLETSAPRNLPFYERLGFTVTADVEVPEGPRTWCMTRKPGA
nr:mRuby-2A-PuroR [Cloning vector FC550A_Dinosaur_COL1A1]WBU87785.1 mRuby-2A-PuroR [Cloning vector FC550A_Mammoth_MYH13]